VQFMSLCSLIMQYKGLYIDNLFLIEIVKLRVPVRAQRARASERENKREKSWFLVFS